MSYNKNKRKQPQKEEKFPLGLLLPIIAFLAIIPLITMMHNYNNNLGQFEWFTTYTDVTDFFLYFKMVWIIITCGYLVFCLIYLFFAVEKNPSSSFRSLFTADCLFSLRSHPSIPISLSTESSSSLNLSGYFSVTV